MNHFLIIIFIFSSLSLCAEDCTQIFYLKQGMSCELTPILFSPTQHAAGMKSVLEKKEKIIKKFKKSPKKLLDYLREKNIPVVIAREFYQHRRGYYLIDGHHTMLALTLFNEEFKQNFKANIEVIKEAESLNIAEFWMMMTEKSWAYHRKLGALTHPREMPQTLLSLIDDPYRSLSKDVQDIGCYENLDHIAFQEFIWADYLRARVRDPLNLKEGAYFAISDEAKSLNLPGYQGFCK